MFIGVHTIQSVLLLYYALFTSHGCHKHTTSLGAMYFRQSELFLGCLVLIFPNDINISNKQMKRRTRLRCFVVLSSVQCAGDSLADKASPVLTRQKRIKLLKD